MIGRSFCFFIRSILLRMAKRFALSPRSMSSTNWSPRPNGSLTSTIMATTSASPMLARTWSIIRTFSLCSGLWMPGVSRKAICPRSGSLRMPTMRLRVVCGFAETIETLCPRMRFSSVDFPAFGRPTMATIPKPARPATSAGKASGTIGARAEISAAPGFRLTFCFFSLTFPLRILRHPHAIDAPAVGAVDDEFVAVLPHRVPDLRHAAESREDQSGHGLVVVARQLRLQHLLQILDAKQAADQILAAAKVEDGDLFLLVLVGDLADDLLDDVLEGDDPRRAAILVDDDGDLHVLALQLAQQFGDLLRLRDEVRRPGQLAHGSLLVLEDEVEEVLHVDDAGDPVDA